MKAIIFGINGQDGYYLKQLLISNTIEVIGVSRSSGDWIKGNIADFGFVEQLIKTIRPQYVFHLAANSVTSHGAMFENHETIATGTLNLLEAVYRYSKNTKVFLSGSAVQFENRGQPIDEHTPFAALSPYAVARIQSVYAARYFRNLGLQVYIGYFFHHDSPLRGEKHINQRIVRVVQRISAGSDEIIEIGDLKAKKEFNFAADLMEAIWILVNQNMHFEAVIGSGKAYSIEDWLQICFAYFCLDWQKYVVQIENFNSSFQILVSNPFVIHSLGWKFQIDINNLAKMMIQYNGGKR